MSRSHSSAKSRAAALIKACLIIATVVLAMVAGGWRAAQMFGAGDLRAAQQIGDQFVVVTKGDTLWELAIKHGPQGKDPREVIAQIRQINNLTSVDLKPGTVLKVPANS